MLSLSSLISFVPTLLILGAWLFYMVKSKTTLSIILFACSLVSALLSFYQRYYAVTFSAPTNFAERTVVLNWIGTFLTLAYLIYAVAFVVFIRMVIKPRNEAYQFLDDSRLINH